VTNDDLHKGCLAILILAAIPLFFLWSAYNESRTYNRLTGAQTTTWDALFVELRVQDSPLKDGRH
jgi:hypothetical protein